MWKNSCAISLLESVMHQYWNYGLVFWKGVLNLFDSKAPHCFQQYLKAPLTKTHIFNELTINWKNVYVLWKSPNNKKYVGF